MSTRYARRRFAALAAGALGGLTVAAGWRIGATAADAGAWCGLDCGALVGDWSRAAYQAIRAKDGYGDPLAASRTLAMTHLAMHDAANAVSRRFEASTFEARDAGADAAVAVAAAAHGVLAAQLPGQRTMLDHELAKATTEAGRGPGVERGLVLGAAAAQAMLAARAPDGSAAHATYVPSDRPGAYRYTPGFDFLFAPHWATVKPFGLRSADQFRVPPPPALDSATYAHALAEVKARGGKASSERTEDETRYAHFWYEFSDIGWNRVARVLAREHRLDLWEAARLFALVNTALADAYVAGWDSKLHHDAWRPVTAIRAGGDAAWEPLLQTPPIQDHPSTHSALGAAAAAVMAALLGDATPFALTSTTALPENPVRRFANLSAAAQENAGSRVMAGLHFRFACDAGLRLGDRIGRFVVTQHLRRVA